MSVPPLQSATAIAAAAVAAGSAARVISSSFAGLLRSAMDRIDKPGGPAQAPSADEARPAGLLNLAALRERTSRLLQQFRNGLAELLGQHGIDPPDGLRLQLNSFGGVRVADDHPDARRIEALLATRTDLAAAFREIESNAQLLRAGSSIPADANARTFELLLDGTSAEMAFTAP